MFVFINFSLNPKSCTKCISAQQALLSWYHISQNLTHTHAFAYLAKANNTLKLNAHSYQLGVQNMFIQFMGILNAKASIGDNQSNFICKMNKKWRSKSHISLIIFWTSFVDQGSFNLIQTQHLVVESNSRLVWKLQSQFPIYAFLNDIESDLTLLMVPAWKLAWRKL